MKSLTFALSFVASIAFITACGDDGGTTAPGSPANDLFAGPFGEFVVAPDQPAEYPCVTDHNIELQAAEGSEVYSPVFHPDAEAAACADGTVAAISNHGDEIMGRRLYVGDARVPYQSTAEQLKDTTIKGCPRLFNCPRLRVRTRGGSQ